MTKLTDIWLDVDGGIRLDWDNDRHQRVHLIGKEPDSVLEALRRAVVVLQREMAAGHLDDLKKDRPEEPTFNPN